MRGVKPYLAVDNGDGTVKEVPEPPEWIGESAAAEWRRIMPDLVERGRISDADLGAVEAFCLAMGTVRDMQKMITAEGAVINDLKRGPRKHPAIAIQADAMTRARLLASELGLTPVSRQRPGIRNASQTGGNDDDLFARLGF